MEGLAVAELERLNFLFERAFHGLFGWLFRFYSIARGETTPVVTNRIMDDKIAAAGPSLILFRRMQVLVKHIV
jgi:hypothetical protein